MLKTTIISFQKTLNDREAWRFLNFINPNQLSSFLCVVILPPDQQGEMLLPLLWKMLPVATTQELLEDSRGTIILFAFLCCYWMRSFKRGDFNNWNPNINNNRFDCWACYSYHQPHSRTRKTKKEEPIHPFAINEWEWYKSVSTNQSSLEKEKGWLFASKLKVARKTKDWYIREFYEKGLLGNTGKQEISLSFKEVPNYSKVYQRRNNGWHDESFKR